MPIKQTENILELIAKQGIVLGDGGYLIELERRGWVTANWGTSENNRRARYYRLTLVGRKHLTAETGKWQRLTEAISRILQPSNEEGS